MRQRGHHRSRGQRSIAAWSFLSCSFEVDGVRVIHALIHSSDFVLAWWYFRTRPHFRIFSESFCQGFPRFFSEGRLWLKSIRLGPFNVDSQNDASARSVRIFCRARLSNLVLPLFHGFHSRFAKCEKWKTRNFSSKHVYSAALTQTGCLKVYLQN